MLTYSCWTFFHDPIFVVRERMDASVAASMHSNDDEIVQLDAERWATWFLYRLSSGL